jgi:hypothetical protein
MSTSANVPEDSTTSSGLAPDLPQPQPRLSSIPEAGGESITEIDDEQMDELDVDFDNSNGELDPTELNPTVTITMVELQRLLDDHSTKLRADLEEEMTKRVDFLS